MAIVNTTGAREHVTDCERGIWTIKENEECTVSELRRVEIKVLSKQVIIHLIYFAIVCGLTLAQTRMESVKFTHQEK